MIIRCMIWMLAWVLLVESQANARPLSFDVRENNEYEFIKLPDTLKQNNVVFLPDSLIRDTLQYEFSKIKEVAYRRKWTKELYKMIFVNPRKINIDIVQTENSEDRYKPYRGKTIRDIYVKVLPPFGTSVNDTTPLQDSLQWLLSVANSVHQKSAERVIKKQLTVRPGMTVDPFELVQNEQLLKSMSNVDDALIGIQEVQSDTNQVDLVVICKDEFSWTGEVWSNFLNAVDLGLETKNLFKLGHSLHYEASFRGSKDKKWGNLIEYKASNLLGSHMDFYGMYENSYNQDILRVELDKEFLTYKTKWAGGAAYSRVYSSKTLVDRDINKPVELFNYRLWDFWGGTSFYLPEKYSYNRMFYLTGRYTGTSFVDRPEVSSDSNHFYYDRDRIMGALTFTKIKYFKANLIYDFGRTEDIPSGLSGTLLFGYEKSDFTEYGYLGTEWHYSWFNKYTERYYSWYAALGTFLNGYTAESGVFKVGSQYISRLYDLSRHRLRFYSNVDYVLGIKRNPDDYIYFEDANIRGFDSDTTRGTQRLSASMSATLFLPYIKRGFRASVTGFVDWGVLARDEKNLLNSQSYWGIGFSLNLRNDNLILKNVSIRFAFYPKGPPDIHSIEVNVSSRRKSGFYDYRVYKPDAIKYE